jgi:hypothetical protein
LRADVQDDSKSPANKNAGAVANLGFTKLEKNLASLGFFTASSKKVKDIKEKTITLSRVISGKRVIARATVYASGNYGLPITADQDKYLALLKIVSDHRKNKGPIENPVAFTSAELLRLLNNRVTAGKNYDDVAEWLKRMTVTAISSDGVVYFAGRKRWASDTFHVFERAVSFGKELPDGTVADKNYVWLSEWQLENINNNHVLPIDLDTYVQVNNHIAKALVPLLQIWLFASIDDHFFEKRYHELCQILNITEYSYLSDVRRQFAPSLNELKHHAYLSNWSLQRTADRNDFKVVFFHGTKFFTDQTRRLEAKGYVPSSPLAASTPPSERGHNHETILAELTRRGVGRRSARSLLRDLPDTDEALRVIEWADQEIARKNPANPAGFLVHMIRENVTPPDSFLSTRQIDTLEREEQASRLRELKLAQLQSDYQRYKDDEIQKCLAALSDTDYRRQIEQKKGGLQAKFDVFKGCPPETLHESAEKALRRDIERDLPLDSFEEFCESRRLKWE